MCVRTSLVALFVLLFPITGSTQVIYGCIKSNGTLRIVGDSTQCSANETPILWNQLGPQGPRGEQGPPGPAGAEGPPGPALKACDANGDEIGLWAGQNLVFLPAIGITIAISATGELRQNIGEVLFDEPGCQGQAYTGTGVSGSSSIAQDLIVIGARYFVRQRAPLQIVTARSVLDPSCVEVPEPYSNPFVPVDEIAASDLGLTLPLPTPLYVAVNCIE